MNIDRLKLLELIQKSKNKISQNDCDSVFLNIKIQDDYNLVYLNCSKNIGEFDDAFNYAKELSSYLNVDVLLVYEGYDLIVNNNSKLKDALQGFYAYYHVQKYFKMEREYNMFIEALDHIDEDNEYINRRFEHLLDLKNVCGNYVPLYFLDKKLSKKMYELYRLNKEDKYLDGKILEFKKSKRV